MRFDEMTSVPREAWWEGFVYFGEVTQLVGLGKQGKGRLTRAMITRMIMGWPPPPWDAEDPGTPEELFREPMSVIIAATEDDPQADILPSLLAQGADHQSLSRVDWIGDVGVEDENGDQEVEQFSMPRHLEALEARIRQLGNVGLVVLDPWLALSGVNVGQNQAIRSKIIRPLQAIARRTGVAIVIVNHFLPKSTKKDPVANIAGSSGLSQALRVNVQVEPLGDGTHRISTIASNLGDMEPVRYRITGPKGPGTYIEFERPRKAQEAIGWGMLQQRVMNELEGSQHALTAQQLAIRLSLSYDVIKQVLSQLAEESRAAIHRGSWSPVREAIESGSPLEIE